MRKLIIKQLDYDFTPVAGLALEGHYLQSLSAQFKRMDVAHPDRSGVTNSDILRSYLGLLVQGKSDFDAIENFRGEAFFKQALGIKRPVFATGVHAATAMEDALGFVGQGEGGDGG